MHFGRMSDVTERRSSLPAGVGCVYVLVAILSLIASPRVIAETATAGTSDQGWIQIRSDWGTGVVREIHNPDIPRGEQPGSRDDTYVVQPGDSLSSIARKLAGNKDLWEIIARHNHMGNNLIIHAGDTLSIPAALYTAATRSDSPSTVSDAETAEVTVAPGGGAVEPLGSSAGPRAPGGQDSDAGNEAAGAHQVTPINVDMFVGEVKVLGKVDVERVAVGSGKIIRAEVLASQELLVIASSAGSTSLRLWHKSGAQSDFNIRVSEQDPETRLTAQKMIRLKVRMVEFRKSALRRLGIDWGDSLSGPTFATAGDLISNTMYRPAEASEALGSVLPLNVKPFAGYFGIASTLTSRINLLASSGDAVMIAEPVLSCTNGGSASFLAGGEVPYPTTGSNGQTIVDFKEYGIRLDISPRADQAGNIQTSILTEISSIDPAVSIQGAPGLLTRRTQTEVSARHGETIVIAGLLKAEGGQDLDKLPGVSRLPILGKLFQSENLRRDLSELVVFITPEVVDQQAGLSLAQQSLLSRSDNALDQSRNLQQFELLE